MKRALNRFKPKYRFTGIKGKIVKKIEEKRSRSLSIPVVPKGTFEQRAEEDREDDDIVEKAEEACPETMAFEQVTDLGTRSRIDVACHSVFSGGGDCFAGSNFAQGGNDRGKSSSNSARLITGNRRQH